MARLPVNETLAGRSLNFCLPLDLSRLENARLRLVPFEQYWESLSSMFVQETSKWPELFKYLPFGPFQDQARFKLWYDETFGQNESVILFAVLVKQGALEKTATATQNDSSTTLGGSEEYTFAGTIGMLNADVAHSRAEIGYIIILPRFQRTFVATNAHGLLLQHCLDPNPDLELRRVQWQANAQNAASIGSAQRMGYTLEGITRWQRVLPEGKTGVGATDRDGKGLPELGADGRPLGPGRHSVMLSMCWDDWRSGKREAVAELMRR
ncbi:hypothetical protein PV08_02927 [Exophiala spinifera]|uniref:N-acetyltransferase domain-containing protein n=1 Tax=Exophiala spinifera TaxID=91928 RepID=A0A0D2BI51_9EURO|nr:uncharacterized protein PV08_02927 [Exophiala spinifera]KIW18638.1 hypothetical protein PV08_02927 [Exophiala spinifera]